MVLPAKAPVVRARGATVLAPAKAAGPRSRPRPRAAPIASQVGRGSLGCSSPLPEPTRGPRPAAQGLPRLEARARVLEGGGAGVVVHKVSHALVRVLHLPAGRQWWLLDHPAGKEGLTRQALQAVPPSAILCAWQKAGFMAWDWRATAHTLGEESCLGSTPATALSELHSPSAGHTASVQAGPWRTAPSQTLLPPQPPTPACEGLPTAWSWCCGSRNTLAHCPVSSLGEKAEEALVES